MVSGGVAILFLVLAVAILIVLTARVKLNAFVALILVAFLYGIFVGMPFADIIANIRSGFGDTLGYIGIVIVAGTIIATILEKSGGAFSMTNSILSLVSRKRAPLAMSMAGYVVSVPVFCDSGYIILTPLNKGLAKETGRSMAVMAVALGTGLYAAHSMVPPTPGPIAAAGILGADLGLTIMLGLAVSIPAMVAGYLWAIHFARRYEIQPRLAEDLETVRERFGTLPSPTLSFMPIIVPIVLIVLKSVAEMPAHPLGTGDLAAFLSFIGDPVTALTLGILIALLLVKKEAVKEAVSDWTLEGIRNAALVLVITGAGGAFGRVLQGSPIVEWIESNLAIPALGVFLPFAIAAAVKTAQGSSTVAIITTASVMAPMIAVLGLNPALTVIAIGAGSMVMSHANDSYFWVVTQFAEMEPRVGYKAWTSATLVQGLVAFVVVAVLSIFV